MSNIATPEGTARRKKRLEENGIVATGHFRLIHGLNLASLGMGTYLGNPDSETDKLVEAAVKTSITSGAINVIDTAINYRFQKAERAVGRVINQLLQQGDIRRDEVFISTKNGYLTHDADIRMELWDYIYQNLIKPGIISSENISGSQHCMSPAFLKDQLERSLKNLNMESVDLMYLHNSAESQLPEIGKEEYFRRLAAAFEFYEEQRRSQKVASYGMATWNCFRMPADNPEYVSLEEVVHLARDIGGRGHGFRFIQLPLNLAMHEALTTLNQPVNGDVYSTLEAAKKLEIGVFMSAPLLQGNLLKSIHVPKIPMIETSAQLCIQFARSSPGATVAPLVGQKDPKHVEENLRIAMIPPYAKEEFASIFMRHE